MPKHNWTYAAAKNTLLYKFGSIAWVTERKNEFLVISFRKDETISDFADVFYLEAQILTGSRSLTVHDAHIALRTVVKPYKPFIKPSCQPSKITAPWKAWYVTCASVVTLLDPPTLDQSPAQSPTFQGAQRLPPTTTSSCQRLTSLRQSVIAEIRRAIMPLVAT
ncbi:hypothetical protein DSO57_1017479 [Entomophthora muscae]|uniref:Uncharacterized protein n=1 Tax=Entomophthora muscae TaxID=34485 RepID=A0ACC2RW21_9FUNG|nr:hypothetical protein DSO57_1017479 [Entomophthora muscae]